MKIYDKEIYNFEQNVKSLLIILIIFTISFMIGFYCKNERLETQIKERRIEIENLRGRIRNGK